MRETFLPFSPHALGDEEIDEVVSTLRSGWITTGPRVSAFEQRVAESLGAPAALALNSGTAAMHTALAALGVGPGDVVITTPMTFCSSVHVIEHVGAQPVLVDVEPDTLNLDPERLAGIIAGAEKAGQRVGAVMPVHLYGHPCDMDPILDLCRERGIAVVQDAAHALAATYKGRPIGSAALAEGYDKVAACFSFYATKNLTTGEGGMLTGPQELVDEARIWSVNGMSKDALRRYSAPGAWYYEVVRPGFKYNMSDIQAAIGLKQLEKLERFQERRKAIVARYNSAFASLSSLELPAERAYIDHAWHLYVLRLHLDRLTLDRDAFIKALTDRNIGTSVHFIPIHLHPYYRDRYGYSPTDFPVCYREFQRIVSLPLNAAMSDEDVGDVIEAVTDIVERHGR